MTQRIGILTSGGDCAGLNACIRAATQHAITTYGWKVFGIRQATTGLITRPLDYLELTQHHTHTDFLRSGGTFLGSTNRMDPFNFPGQNGVCTDRSEDFIQGYHDLKLDALIGIGGDGSMDILKRLADKGNLNLIGIPKTIDNDIGSTEVAIGYSTALEVATEAIDRLQPTAASHQRIMILEVMGRDAGHIALGAGIAGGADIILIPEIPYTIEGIHQKIAQTFQEGRLYSVIVVSESVKKVDGDTARVLHQHGQVRYGGIGHYLATCIEQETAAETRVTVLGHVQRGATPCAWDRIVASAFGVKAVDLVAKKSFDRMVAWQNRCIVDVPISEVIAHDQTVDPQGILVQTAHSLGIYIGSFS